MPIATPETYAEMLDTAKEKSFAFPAINVSSSQTLNAALQGFADAGSDGIIQVSTGGAEYLSGPTIKNMVTGSLRVRRVRRRGREELPGQRRPAHRPLPEGQARRLRPAAARDLDRAGEERSAAAVPVAHVGRLRRTAGGEPGDRPGAARQGGRRAHRARGRDRRRRRRGGRRRGRWRRAAVQHPRRRAGHGRGARCRRERPLPDRPDVRQRARRLQAGQRQAPPGDPAEGPAGGGREARPARGLPAVRPGLPRRLGLDRARRSPRPSTSAW